MVCENDLHVERIVKATVPQCGRCLRPAATIERMTIGAGTYDIPLCDDHGDALQRLLFGWARSGSIVDDIPMQRRPELVEIDLPVESPTVVVIEPPARQAPAARQAPVTAPAPAPRPAPAPIPQIRRHEPGRYTAEELALARKPVVPPVITPPPAAPTKRVRVTIPWEDDPRPATHPDPLAPEPAPVAPRPTPFDAAQAMASRSARRARVDTGLPLNWEKWKFTAHATERGVQRRITREQAIWAAECPEISRPGTKAGTAWHIRGHVVAVVEVAADTIVTVIDRRELPADTLERNTEYAC